MTVDQIIALSSSLGTCISTVFVLFTLREMSKQRTSTYRPEIISSRQPVNIGISNVENSLNIRWTNQPEEYVSITNPCFQFDVPFFNIGNGAAKSLMFEWAIEIDEIINQLNDLIIQTGQRFSIKTNDKNEMSYKFGESSCMIINLNNDLKFHKDYLLPSSIDKNGIVCRLPSSYMLLTTLILFITTKFKNTSNIDISPLTLNLTYFDIADKKIHKQMTFSLSICSISHINGGSEITCRCLLDVVANKK